jgi:hypothetical protein
MGKRKVEEPGSERCSIRKTQAGLRMEEETMD